VRWLQQALKLIGCLCSQIALPAQPCHVGGHALLAVDALRCLGCASWGATHNTTSKAGLRHSLLHSRADHITGAARRHPVGRLWGGFGRVRLHPASQIRTGRSQGSGVRMLVGAKGCESFGIVWGIGGVLQDLWCSCIVGARVVGWPLSCGRAWDGLGHRPKPLKQQPHTESWQGPCHGGHCQGWSAHGTPSNVCISRLTADTRSRAHTPNYNIHFPIQIFCFHFSVCILRFPFLRWWAWGGLGGKTARRPIPQLSKMGAAREMHYNAAGRAIFR